MLKSETCNLSDTELVRFARLGDKPAENTLIERYTDYVFCLSRKYFVPGGDREDLIQEGLLGLLEAVRDYDESMGGCFRAFASVCISRKIVSAVRSASRKKHLPLNSYISLDVAAPYFFQNDCFDPEEIVADRESLLSIGRIINGSLSDREKNVLLCYLSNMSYRETAKLLSVNEKAVDNALNRLRRKLSAVLADD